ncbi:hypothetical protein TNIN_414211 [Trichonephila inaurata madagascariensis]|uniref:Uncharacterized protein n=1 Tax=Trichonephila inaurata madagascariensis TaxID=2747483 RepID=A0A8X7C5X0_9ARAC|nr:hypothetical protein TNIN_414211 [Trichonephila inaurata madagascariensis]
MACCLPVVNFVVEKLRLVQPTVGRRSHIIGIFFPQGNSFPPLLHRPCLDENYESPDEVVHGHQRNSQPHSHVSTDTAEHLQALREEKKLVT